MKRVLITGANSYVGGWVCRRLEREPDQFEVAELDVRGEGWRSFDFSGWDAVFHVAGIAHVSADPKMEDLYYKVNRDLAIEVGQRAKAAGVGQFVFMSSAIVYGDSASAGEGVAIDLATEPGPVNFYGKSKLEAEYGLVQLEGSAFAVSVIRAPMIYGPHCKGNFPVLVRLARKLPVFPEVNNRRSMLYVCNLAELVTQLVAHREGGLFLPQDDGFARTSDLVGMINRLRGGNIRFTKVFNPVLEGPMRNHPLVRKAFGDLFYAREASEFSFSYQRYSMENAVREIAAAGGWLA